MNRLKIIMALSFFIWFSVVSNCNSEDFRSKIINNRINLSDPRAVAAEANKNSGISSQYSEVLQDPLINSTLNSMGAMMQGSTGGAYDQQEQMKRQLDYAKQQSTYSEGE